MTIAEHPATPPVPGERQAGTLAVSVCERCGFSQLAERACERCYGTTSRREIDATGAVLAATVVERAPDEVVLQAPFAMALVELDGGPQLLAVASGRAHFEPGDRVAVGEERVERGGVSVVAHVVRRTPARLGAPANEPGESPARAGVAGPGASASSAAGVAGPGASASSETT